MGFTTFPRNEAKWGKTDWSRPSYTVITKPEEKQEEQVTLNEHKVAVVVNQPSIEQQPSIISHQPRFSVFGKKAKITEINKRQLKEEEEEDNTTTNNTISTFKRNNKFELHLSTKSHINNKLISHPDNQQLLQHSNNSTKQRQSVKFDPLFLETVCLFHETESPLELEPLHQQRPQFRVLCQRWPSSINTTTSHDDTMSVNSDISYTNNSNIILSKSSFQLDPVHQNHLKGQVKVRNLALDKSVTIRYSLDYGQTIQEVDGNFFGPDPRHPSTYDIFEFSIDDLTLNDRGEVRGRVELSVMFTAGQMDYWDTNQGRNYVIKVICDPLNNDTDMMDESLYDSELSGDDDDHEYQHSHFTTALKGYQHARPYYLTKRQPWLGTRYDFKQSLYLARRAPYETWSTTVRANPNLITDYFLSKPMMPVHDDPQRRPPSPTHGPGHSVPDTSAQQQQHHSTSISAPPSPTSSPPPPFLHEPSKSMTFVEERQQQGSLSPVDTGSSFYLDLIEKYCFYRSEHHQDEPVEVFSYSP